MEINILQCIFLELGKFSTRIFIHDEYLFRLLDVRHDVNENMPKLRVLLVMDRATPLDEIAFTDQSVFAKHFLIVDIFSLT